MKYRYFTALALFLFLSVSCGTFTQKTVAFKIKGSDTMLFLMQHLAKEYMKTNPHVAIYVEGGGTGAGVDALLKSEAQLCMASNKLKPEEVKSLADKFQTVGVSILIAKDALSIYVNKENPVRNISMEQLKKIYSCEITNWSELGGDNNSIELQGRPNNSGTFFYFKNHVLKGLDYCDNVTNSPTMEKLLEKVADSKYAIGYGGFSVNNNNIRALSIDGIEATTENVISDNYPINRYLRLFSVASPSGEIKEFIDWVLSPEGQKLVSNSGYIPLWKVSF
jgi:phosphate transport system substrate-binding protein